MSRSARKRQTRLTFDSLPPSSPASAGYNQHIRDRAALVRFDDPNPAKKRKVRDAPGASSRASSEMSTQVRKESLPPTPDPTAPTQTSLGASAVSDDSDSGPSSLPTQRMSNRKKLGKGKQRKLEFDLTPVSPSDKPRNKPAGINNALPVKAGFFGSQKPQTTSADSSDDGASDQEFSELPTAAKTKSKTKSKDKSKKRISKKSISPDLELESEPEKPAAPKITATHINVDEESDEDDVPTTPAANRRGLKRKRRSEPSSSPLIIDDDEDEDSDVVITGSRKRSQSAKKRSISAEPEQESSEEEEPPSRSRKRLRRGKSSQMTTIDEEERQELEDDLLDLATSGSDAEVRLRQKKKPTKRNARELALAQLKRKRQGGANAEASDDYQEDPEQDPEDDQSDVIEAYQDLDEDEEEEEEEDDIPQPSRTTRKQMFTQTEEDEDFIIADDDAPLGAPTEAPTGVPIAFTRFASMKAKELFKFAIEWMVQKKLNPAFQISDEIYTLTFQKLDDEVRGLAGSKFTSSAWTQDFTFALQARPEISYDRIDRRSSAHFMRDKCDACNRSGHPATYEVRFEGKPYHKETLEPVAPINDDSDSDSDSSSSESSDKEGVAVNRDSHGRKILPEDTTFYLGKFCMSNAQTSHSLQHWRFHLYEWVVEYLEHAGYNTPDLIVKRDKWSTRKRRKYANKVVDKMQEEGKIKALYRDFKTEIDTARNAKQGRWDSSP